MSWFKTHLPGATGVYSREGTGHCRLRKSPIRKAYAYEIFQKKQDGAIKILLTP